MPSKRYFTVSVCLPNRACTQGMDKMNNTVIKKTFSDSADGIERHVTKD